MPLQTLRIQAKDLDILIDWARQSLPYEGCALMLGTWVEDQAEVKEIILEENVDHSSVQFSIDPEHLYEAYMEAERKGMEIVGIFHSHPAPSYPSGLDLEYMKVNPVAWVILGGSRANRGFKTRNIKVYQYLNETLHEVSLEIT